MRPVRAVGYQKHDDRACHPGRHAQDGRDEVSSPIQMPRVAEHLASPTARTMPRENSGHAAIPRGPLIGHQSPANIPPIKPAGGPSGAGARLGDRDSGQFG